MLLRVIVLNRSYFISLPCLDFKLEQYLQKKQMPQI